MTILPETYYRPDADELRPIAAKQTLASWRCSGKGPTFHHSGSRILYKGADILTWLDENRVGANPLEAA